jgi:hypothetical protein
VEGGGAQSQRVERRTAFELSIAWCAFAFRACGSRQTGIALTQATSCAS